MAEMLIRIQQNTGEDDKFRLGNRNIFNKYGVRYYAENADPTPNDTEKYFHKNFSQLQILPTFYLSKVRLLLALAAKGHTLFDNGEPSFDLLDVD